MPGMLDQIRASAVSAETMRAAARGALPVPPAEMIEILVFLASNPVFGQQARMTLAGWDEAACATVVGDPAAPAEVLNYFVAAENRRPALLPSLLANPSVPEAALLEMAQEHSRDVVRAMLTSERVLKSPNLLQALVVNPVLGEAEVAKVRHALEICGEQAATTTPEEVEQALARYQSEHAEEIAAEEGKAYELIADPEDAVPAAATVRPAPPAERLSVYQRIARLSVGERVQLAMKGTREERFILVRDGAKVVATAVLDSPKLTDQEVETFAAMKNVQEAVLRGIAGRRKFMKNYGVVRALTNNPRCPLDIQLTLMKNLLNSDLRNLSANKNVADTVRKLALKMYKERTEKKQSR